MTIKNIEVFKAIENIKSLLKQDQNISPSLRAAIDLLILIINLMIEKIGLNSKNSSNPPSQDPNRKKTTKRNNNKRGAQKGHEGSTLKQVDNPDEIIDIPIDKKTLPEDIYIPAGYKKRQVLDIKITRHVTEYRAEMLKNQKGKIFIAPFPDEIINPIQYGQQIKSHAVYLSQFQLIPYERVTNYFHDQVGIPLSSGSIYSFIQRAFIQLEAFEKVCKKMIIQSKVAHADETGINIDGKRKWLHCISNKKWTHFYPHEKRGGIAIEEIGIIPSFNGILVHDHWKPYYSYNNCRHALCNAHHLRELERVYELEKHEWAQKMKTFLLEIDKAVNEQGGCLHSEKYKEVEQWYLKILNDGEVECPIAIPPPGKKRVKKSKSRNLLERLLNYKNDVLRFAYDIDVTFTNNLGENDIRMTKVQQKISGCFRSLDGAKAFCRIRSFLSTCRKHNISASDALAAIFQQDLSDFISKKLITPE